MGIGNFAETTKGKWTLDDIAARSGKNLDVVFAAIAVTLASPYLAIAGALLSSLYYSSASKRADKTHRNSCTIPLKSNFYRATEADKLLHEVAYEGYLDSLIRTYA